MKRFSVAIIALLLILSGGNAWGELIDIAVPGGEFSPFSKGCLQVTKSGGSSCLLNALNSGQYAIYNFELRADAKRISVSAKIENQSRREIDVYVYNYGKRRESSFLSKPKLEDRWLRWETVQVDEKWQTRSPEFLDAVTSNREWDLLGPHNVVRLLFYADPGVPPNNEVFIINSVTLGYETTLDWASAPQSSESKVWTEGGVIFAHGIGFPSKKLTNPAQVRAMAVRAATVDAQRNMLAYLQEVPVPPSGSTAHFSLVGKLVGATTEDTEYLDDGSVRITLALPIKRALTRSSR